ncbi:MAG: inorganic phosphate transporter, partial [Clostridiales bacterium]|nr:inorganic phosphate transporter [Clostridiales bacterium]
MNIAFIVIIILVLAVVFVNGWTDAPNAIATAVSTRVLRPRSAIVIAVIFNLLGAMFMTAINAQVAETISKMVNFEGSGSHDALVVLAAALFAIVAWATAAWYFGIPTSESHALIAGLTGAALALNGLAGVNMNEWSKVVVGLVISTAMGFILGFLVVKLIEFLFRRAERFFADRFFGKGQVFAAASMAFLHG